VWPNACVHPQIHPMFLRNQPVSVTICPKRPLKLSGPKRKKNFRVVQIKMFNKTVVTAGCRTQKISSVGAKLIYIVLNIRIIILYYIII